MAPANTARPGSLPFRKNTVLCAVLAYLLSGNSTRSLDALHIAGTVRLAAFVFTLKHHYGWPIKSRDVSVDCSDGRTASVAEYRLAPEVIEAAIARGDGAWMEEVFEARKVLRAKRGQA